MTVHLYGPDGYFKFKDSYKKEGKLEVEKIRGGGTLGKRCKC